MRRQPDNLLGIRDAALRLGVSVPTLRRWDKQGKLVALRHRFTGERVYRRDALDAIADGAAPAPHTDLVGRDAELGRILRAIRGGARLVTLVGPGGIGKTALAREALAALEAEWSTCFCDLTAATPERVASALAAALGVELGADDEVARHLARLGPTLVMLDNAEHVASATASLVRALRNPAPELACIVTSRERLRLQGELVLETGPLARDAAVTLLVRSAERSGAAIDRTRHEKALARIAARLERIPLALELAGAQLLALTPEELEHQLSLDLLENRARDAPARHATLRAAIAWSFELLTPRERELMAALSVFRGGFDAPAAQAIDGRGATRLLHSLRDKSMLRSGEGPARFDLFVSIRDFAADELARSAAEADVRERHARWFAELARSALDAPPTDVTVDALAREHENLRVASAWATEHDAALALLFAVAIDYAAGATTGIDQRVELFDAAIDNAPRGESRLLARALATRGRLLLERGDVNCSKRDLDAAHRAAGRARDRELSDYVLGLLAAWNVQFKSPAEALRAAARAERAARSGAARPTRALVWTQIGSVQHELGALDRAEANFARALALARSEREPVLAARIAARLGRVYVDADRPDDAEEALSAVETLAGDRFEAWALAHRALLRWRRGRLDDAREHYARSVRLFAARGASGFETVHRALLAAVLAAQGRGVDALAELAQARIDAGADAGLLLAIELGEAHRRLLEARRKGERPDAIVREALRKSRRLAARDKDIRALAERLQAAAGDDLPVRATLFVARDGAWLSAPGYSRAVLPAGSPLRALLAALAKQHGAAALTRDELTAAAWPRERMLPRAAAQRIHAAISELRALGLGNALERTRDGYRIAPSLPVRIEGDQG